MTRSMSEPLVPVPATTLEPCFDAPPLWRPARVQSPLSASGETSAPKAWQSLIAPSEHAAPPATALAANRFGPARLADGRTRFRLWAPDAAARGQPVRLEIRDHGPQLMSEVEPGWFEAVAACCDGAHYWFRLDDGTVVPDPASRAQADDIHGASLVVNPDAYQWCHPYWQGRPWHEAIVYEMHVGLAGGFAGATQALPRLAALGFTAIELMPVAEFPGSRNWGYDGVLPFAPEHSYGTPDQLRALVDAAHGLGMMVLLDVVYNHFGPDGNYLHQYASAFFRHDVSTPWGDAIDFRRPEVRCFFSENAAYWLDAFRFDGLRLDAVHAIADEGWLAELGHALRAARPERYIHLVLENDDNDADLLRPAHGPASWSSLPSHPGAGFDAQWNDDGHHALHVLLSGEADGYYSDYATDAAGHEAAIESQPAVQTAENPTGSAALRHLARVLAEGFAYQGEVSGFRTAANATAAASGPGEAATTSPAPVRRGKNSAALPPTAFVLFLQNHDQTGNRAFGERLTLLARPTALRAAITMQLLCPQVPLVFMGEECGAESPFLFFTSHGPELAQAVREGRRREFGATPAFGDPALAGRIPDPNAQDTFDRSLPASVPGNLWAPLYQRLLAVRRRELLHRLPQSRSEGVRILGNAALRARWRLGDGAQLTIWLNLADQPIAVAHEIAADAVQSGTPLAESEDGALDALLAGTLGADTALVCLREPG